MAQYFNFSHYQLQFKTPVLERSDIMYLTKTVPSNKMVNDSSELWQYHLIKESASTDALPIHLSFELLFQHGKLAQLTYPNQISQLFGTYLIQLGFDSVSKGTYLAQNNVLIPGEPDDYTINKDDLPNRQSVIQHFGPPSEITNQENGVVFLYRYTVKNTQKTASKPWIAFEFITGREAITSVSGTLFGPHVQFGFE